MGQRTSDSTISARHSDGVPAMNPWRSQQSGQFTESKAHSQRSFCERYRTRRASPIVGGKLRSIASRTNHLFQSQDFHSLFNNF
ncbi:MAG: hypothetical protein ACYTXT_43990 [Nostoc sp.]